MGEATGTIVATVDLEVLAFRKTPITRRPEMLIRDAEGVERWVTPGDRIKMTLRIKIGAA